MVFEEERKSGIIYFDVKACKIFKCRKIKRESIV